MSSLNPPLMITGTDLTKTATLSAAADASGSDSPAEKTRPEIESSQSKNENQPALSYAEKTKHNESPQYNCNCSPRSALRATDAPFRENKFYCQVSEKLKTYGQIESISLDTAKRSHTVIYRCGCQATNAKKADNFLSQPYRPPLNHEPNYFPAEHFTNNTDHSQKTEIREPPPAPTCPKFFRIKPIGTPSVLSIMASLTNAIGKVEPTSLTRARDHFVLKVLKEDQSLMLTEGKYPPCPVIERVTPHTELNTSKAVCHNRDLYNTPLDIIKRFTTPRVQDVQKVKSSNNVTIITFPTSQPPTNIKALGFIFKLEPYRERPRQCNHCFSYTHITSSCSSEPLCDTCSQPKRDHPPEGRECSPRCRFCGEAHPPKSKACPTYKFEEALLNEALKRGCGRGHVRAEWRQTQSQDGQTDEPLQKTKPR